MKKIMGLLSLVIAVTTMSCGSETKEEKKEVIVVPSTPAPKKEVIIVPATPAPATQKGTSVSMDKNGVKVEVKK